MFEDRFRPLVRFFGRSRSYSSPRVSRPVTLQDFAASGWSRRVLVWGELPSWPWCPSSLPGSIFWSCHDAALMMTGWSNTVRCSLCLAAAHLGLGHGACADLTPVVVAYMTRPVAAPQKRVLSSGDYRCSLYL